LVGTRDQAPAQASRSSRLIRIAANVVGAVGAAYFAKASLDFYVDTHRFIGAALLVEQLCVVVAYLVRRPARAVTTRMGDWLLAFGERSVACSCGRTALIRSGESASVWWFS
jgi:hypothetical protein